MDEDFRLSFNRLDLRLAAFVAKPRAGRQLRTACAVSFH
jgi:hypothetical protein